MSSAKLFATQSQLLKTLSKKPFENIVGNRENAGNRHFSLFPIMFSILSKTKIIILSIFTLSSAKALNLDQSRISSFGKELRGLNVNGCKLFYPSQTKG